MLGGLTAHWPPPDLEEPRWSSTVRMIQMQRMNFSTGINDVRLSLPAQQCCTGVWFEKQGVVQEMNDRNEWNYVDFKNHLLTL